MDINGNWTGTLIYGKSYSEDIVGKELTFELKISESNGDIIGSGRDVSGFGLNPSEFTIKGFIDEATISFIKQYKSNAYFDLDDKLIIDANEPSFEITYSGIYNEETNQFEGDWDILIEQKQFGDSWLDDEYVGTWVMAKH
jgi:hypothetical protein